MPTRLQAPTPTSTPEVNPAWTAFFAAVWRLRALIEDRRAEQMKDEKQVEEDASARSEAMSP